MDEEHLLVCMDATFPGSRASLCCFVVVVYVWLFWFVGVRTCVYIGVYALANNE